MKVLIICPVFPPEPVISAQTIAQVARSLAADEHQVTVLTAFPNRPAGKIFSGYRRTFVRREKDPAGFDILRCFSFFSPRSSMLNRWLENISFGLISSLVLLFLPRADVIFSNTWPIFATALISLVSKIRNIKMVLSVQDMYPESLVNQERLQAGSLLYKILLGIDRWIARQAAEIIVISNNFTEGYRGIRQISPAKLHVIANWVDAGSVTLPGKSTYRQEAGISQEAFVVAYGGNIGVAAGVETVLEALSQLQIDQEVVLVIAGSGSQLAACQKKAESLAQVRTVFHSPWAREDTSKVLAAADILVLPTRGRQSLVSVPSKLIAYMLSERPVLAAVLEESETAQIIHSAQCGWVVPPDDIQALSQAVQAAMQLPAEKNSQMGSGGRAYALQHFTTEKCLPEVIQIITEAAGAS